MSDYNSKEDRPALNVSLRLEDEIANYGPVDNLLGDDYPRNE